MENESPPSPGRSRSAPERWRMASRVIRTARRFRYSLESAKGREEANRLRKTREKLRIAGLVSAAALQFLQGKLAHDGGKREELDDARRAGFRIGADEASSLVLSPDSGDRPSVLDVEDVARKLCVTIDEGINSDTQPTPPVRQKIFGLNAYNNSKFRKSFWTFIRGGLSDTTIMVILFCTLVSMGIQVALEGWPEGCSYAGIANILSAFLVVTTVAYCDYNQYLLSHDFTEQREKVVVMRGGKREYLPSRDIVVGEVVILSTGDQIPADGLCISGYNLLVDESTIDGQSTEPLTIQENNRLLAGTKVVDGSGKMLVVSVGMRTVMGKLMTTPNQSGERATPLLKKIDDISKITVAISLFVSLLALLVQLSVFLTGETSHTEPPACIIGLVSTLLKHVVSALSIFVVGVPAGMSLAVKLYLHFARMQLKTEGALVKHLSSCEMMASVTNICSDKTGTLTANHMVVSKLLLCGEVISSQGAPEFLESDINYRVPDILLQSVFLNTCSEMVEEHGSKGKHTDFGRPTELALLKFGLSTKAHRAIGYEDFKKLNDIPFNSNDKMRSVLVTCPDGTNRAFCTGAADIVLDSCSHIVTSDGKSLHLSAENREVVLDTINMFCNEALRTLCLAFKDLDPSDMGIPSNGYTLIAVVGITDLLRPEVKDAVRMCSDAGITVRMVTGDSINTAKAIAKECGILKDGGLAIEGHTLRAFGPEELKQQILKYQVFARCSPEDKGTVVSHLKIASAGVAAVGDGINDSRIIQEADIGLAMGIAGAEAAKEGADVVILDDDFATIPHLVKWGRAVYMNILGFVQFQLTLNAVAVAVNFVTWCYLGFALLPPVLVLWVNLALDTSYALTLATEPSNELMNQPPVTRGDRLITKVMWRNIIGQSLYQSSILTFFIFYGRILLKLEGPGAADVLNTFIVYTFVFCQVFNVLNDQVVEKINFGNICSSSSWKVTAIMISRVTFPGIFAVLVATFAAGSVSLSWQLWLVSIFVGSMTMVLSFLFKCIPVEKKEAPEDHHDCCYHPLASSPLADKR